jgi:hypothetical protein
MKEHEGESSELADGSPQTESKSDQGATKEPESTTEEQNVDTSGDARNNTRHESPREFIRRRMRELNNEKKA